MKEKGYKRTYGRGAGEREYKPITPRPKQKQVAVLYDPGHAPYPRSGAYTSEIPDKPKEEND